MKFVLYTCILSLVTISCCATNWIDIKSPIESPRYKEILQKLFPDSTKIADNTDDTQNITRRISNGFAAHLGQFPYQVYLYLFNRLGETYLCGGSIIHSRWILTASHCLENIVRVEVYIGAINRFKSGVGAYIKAINITESRSIILHPKYNPQLFANDIGLLKLPEEVPNNNVYVRTLALPRGVDATMNLVGRQGIVAGFGRFSDSDGNTSEILNYIALPIVENSVCSNIYSLQLVTGASVCLASIGIGSVCQGDSGGALTVTGENSTTIQVGIVSFGHRSGCQLGYPQVFERVSSHMAWINSQVSSASLLAGVKFVSLAIILAAQQYFMM